MSNGENELNRSKKKSGEKNEDKHFTGLQRNGEVSPSPVVTRV